jgi:hypothetical protein
LENLEARQESEFYGFLQVEDEDPPCFFVNVDSERVNVLCFDTLLQVLILNVLFVAKFYKIRCVSEVPQTEKRGQRVATESKTPARLPVVGLQENSYIHQLLYVKSNSSSRKNIEEADL